MLLELLKKLKKLKELIPTNLSTLPPHQLKIFTGDVDDEIKKKMKIPTIRIFRGE